MEHRHPERAKGFGYLGFHRYLLTFCTHQRAPVFTSTASVELVLAQISRAANEERLAVLAYCFMPDHLHLLVKGECEARPIASDMDMTMSFATASEQEMSSDTSSRTR
jgi:hypothetical protein